MSLMAGKTYSGEVMPADFRNFLYLQTVLSMTFLPGLIKLITQCATWYWTQVLESFMALKEEKGHSALKYQEITGVMEISAAAGGKRVSLSAEQLLFR